MCSLRPACLGAQWPHHLNSQSDMCSNEHSSLCTVTGLNWSNSSHKVLFWTQIRLNPAGKGQFTQITQKIAEFPFHLFTFWDICQWNFCYPHNRGQSFKLTGNSSVIIWIIDELLKSFIKCSSHQDLLLFCVYIIINWMPGFALLIIQHKTERWTFSQLLWAFHRLDNYLINRKNKRL